MASETTRIMIVEDDTEVAESVAELLRHDGFVVEIAGNGEIAVQRAQAESSLGRGAMAWRHARCPNGGEVAGASRPVAGAGRRLPVR